jgi:L,D-transpeptidase catalytic domain
MESYAMKSYLRLLLIGGVLTAVFGLATPAFADDCMPTIGANTFEYICHRDDVADSNDGTTGSESEDSIADRFIVPAPREDSLIDRRWYGRLADNANVYAEPSRSAAIVRNVGDGYLFATVNSWADNDAGETWYNINYGEYVHQDDINLVDQSDFQGVEISSQPERPFGWVVADFFPSTEPDGEPDESLPRVIRYTFVEIYDIVLGEDDWLWYDIGNGRWVKQTYFSIVDVSPRPEDVGENEFWVEVDLYEQTFAAYEGDQMVYATVISSGLNRWPTREGLFQVEEQNRFREYKMSGAEGRIDYYFLEDVPYIMYFDMYNGIALHGTYWHDRYGYKQSHGCVNMTILDAEWTFNWSAEAPNDLWVWVHTSDPLAQLD